MLIIWQFQSLNPKHYLKLPKLGANDLFKLKWWRMYEMQKIRKEWPELSGQKMPQMKQKGGELKANKIAKMGRVQVAAADQKV